MSSDYPCIGHLGENHGGSDTDDLGDNSGHLLVVAFFTANGRAGRLEIFGSGPCCLAHRRTPSGLNFFKKGLDVWGV